MSNQPPYGYDPQNPSSGYPPAYGQQPGYQPPAYPQQPDYSQQQPGYPPPPPGQPGQYSQPLYGGQPGQPAPYSQPMYGAQPGMYPAGPYAPGMPAAPDQGGGMAIAGLVIGIIAALAWLVPICGFIPAVLGIIFSALGRKSVSRRTMATVGLVLSIIGLVLTIINAALGVYFAMQKQ